jgi:hypothetical protein
MIQNLNHKISTNIFEKRSTNLLYIDDFFNNELLSNIIRMGHSVTVINKNITQFNSKKL